jgi:hypothetical protein
MVSAMGTPGLPEVSPPGSPPPPSPSGTGPSPSPPASGRGPAPAPGGSPRPKPPGTTRGREKDYCRKCHAGKLKVTVKKTLVCWDSGSEGDTTPDKPLEGATVRVSLSECLDRRAPLLEQFKPIDPKTTDSNGEVTFDLLIPGRYTVTAEKDNDKPEGYMVAPAPPPPPPPAGGTPAPAPRPGTVVEEGKTATAEVTLQIKNAVCNRKHLPPSPSPGIPRSIWLPILWFPWNEPWVMAMRDLLFLAAVGFSIAGMATLNLAMVAFFVAWGGYLTNVIWGKIPGIIMICAAGVLLVAMVVVAAVAAGAPVIPDAARSLEYHHPVFEPIVDLGWFPVTCGTWMAFLIALIIGRVESYSNKNKGWIVLWVLIGAAVAVGLCVMFLAVAHREFSEDLSVGLIILAILAGAVSGGVAGLLGHTFRNEGEIEPPVWGKDDFLLPFEGEHYCVQGPRGYISHFTLSSGYDERFAYDFEFPEATPILCAKEGHVIQVREKLDGSAICTGNENPNHVWVLHRDGTVAKYLHLQMDGITKFNPALMALFDRTNPEVTVEPSDDATKPEREIFKREYTFPTSDAASTGTSAKRNNPVHIHAGQIIGAAGNVGVSMFNHLHFIVTRSPADTADPQETDRTIAPDGTDDSGKPKFKYVYGEYYGGHRPVKFKCPDVQRHDGQCRSMRKYSSSNTNLGAVKVP